MGALYHQIGFGVGVDRHETDAARSVAIQVMRELSPGWKPDALRLIRYRPSPLPRGTRFS